LDVEGLCHGKQLTDITTELAATLQGPSSLLGTDGLIVRGASSLWSGSCDWLLHIGFLLNYM